MSCKKVCKKFTNNISPVHHREDFLELLCNPFLYSPRSVFPLSTCKNNELDTESRNQTWSKEIIELIELFCMKCRLRGSVVKTSTWQLDNYNTSLWTVKHRIEASELPIKIHGLSKERTRNIFYSIWIFCDFWITL